PHAARLPPFPYATLCRSSFASGAIGAFDGSCATSAARYASAVDSRHARSQDLLLWAIAVDAVIVTPTSAARSVFMRRILTRVRLDRKSTRLNSSHRTNSY